MTEQDNLCYANGINGATGSYGFAPITENKLADLILNHPKPDNQDNLAQKDFQVYKTRYNQLLSRKNKLAQKPSLTVEEQQDLEFINHDLASIKHRYPTIEDFGVVEGVNATNLAEAGWGIIFADGDAQTEQIKAALQPLLQLRQNQSGPLFKIFAGTDGYRKNEYYLKFLGRHGASSGPVKPEKGVPYYLLIVGSPEVIPFKFQYQLDIQFAVGRIYFEDIADYARYAQNVVDAETGKIKLPRQVTFFSPQNPNDKPTQMSSDYLIKPLYEKYSRMADWQVDLYGGDIATKAKLSEILNGTNTPALLFTASHGIEFPKDDPRQRSHQGALVCQDWPGRRQWRGKPIPPEFYFAGEDLASNVNLSGLMSFHFACYGAGTPQFDEFSQLESTPKAIASKPFLAQLPLQLLRHGALACIGHVERAWEQSFFWADSGSQVGVFESTLERLYKGQPIGLALEYFNERYAELSTTLIPLLDKVDAGLVYPPNELTNLWTATNDARNYLIIGDPATRLPVAQVGEATTPRAATVTLNENLRSGGEAHHIPASFTLSGTAKKKPVSSISDEDWQNTPPAVQQTLIEAIELINKLKKSN